VARPLDLEALGEFGLIEAIRRRAGSVRRPWLLGIGDDAALLRPRAGTDLAWTHDALIEAVHFRWDTTDAASLGRKALAVNLSDLGASGARPLGFLLSLGLPQQARPAQIDGFLGGLLAEARAADCPLVGGDTVAAPVWTLGISAVGELARGRALRRGGARAGDRLLVTGTLGGAALGLALLESGAGGLPGAAAFVRRQQRPRPPWRAGPLLARRGPVSATAAIDLSDGLAADLGQLARASGLAAEVWVERLPRARGYAALCHGRGQDPEALALSGGEDYELLFSVASSAPAAGVFQKRLGCRTTEIGVLRSGRGVRWLRHGVRLPDPAGGFEHFKTSRAPSDK
jgi:thiamine-monophosphate kinase